MFSRRILVAAVSVLILVIFVLAWRLRFQQDVAAREERALQQFVLTQQHRPSSSSSADAVAEREHELKLAKSQPSQHRNFARENQQFLVGAPKAKITPHCSSNSGDDDKAVTAIVRASHLKQSPMCYYEVCNFCVTDGALEFFAPVSAAIPDATTAAPPYPTTTVSPLDATTTTTTTLSPKQQRKKNKKKPAAKDPQSSAPTPRPGFRPQVADLPPLRLCNELRARISLPVVDADAIRRLNGSIPNATTRDAMRELPFLQRHPVARDWISDRNAHVVVCWNFYGYHLFQCSVAAFYVELLFNHHLHSSSGGADENNMANDAEFAAASLLKKLNRTAKKMTGNATTERAFEEELKHFGETPFDIFLYNHAITMQRLVREHFSHAMYMGSNTSWTSAQRVQSQQQQQQQLTEQEQSDEAAVRPAPWWGMWAVNALSGPSTVEELFRFPRRGTTTKTRKCYRRGIIGQPVHRVVPHSVRHLHVAMLRRIFRVPEPLHLSGTPANMAAPDFSEDARCVSLREEEESVVRVLIAQRGAGNRQGSRRIQNVEHLVNALESVFRGQGHLFSANDESGVIGHHQAAEFEGHPGTLGIVAEKKKKRDKFAFPQQQQKHKKQQKPTLSPQELKQQQQQREHSSGPGLLDAVSLAITSKVRLQVELVDFATIPFDEQLRMTSRASVLISTHGAGNVWLSFLPRGRSVFMELWPQNYVARDVYRAMCLQYDVKYAPVFADMQPLFGPKGSKEAANSFLHQDVRVPIDQFVKVLHNEVAPFVLRASRCRS